MQAKKAGIIWILISMVMLIFLTPAAYSGGPYRIVVVPFFIESGSVQKIGESQNSLLRWFQSVIASLKSEKVVIDPARDYRRVSGFINNQLRRHGFEVINIAGADLKEEEYNKLIERARSDSMLACKDLCRRYATDIAYIVWLDVKAKRMEDGKCKVSARVEGKGYDSAGRDLGAAVSKSFTTTRDDCDDAVVGAEKEAAEEVGRVLTAWSGGPPKYAVDRPAQREKTQEVVITSPDQTQRTQTTSYPTVQNRASTEGGILQRNATALENVIDIKLLGATEYALTETFGKVITTAPGVVSARLYNTQIKPTEPQACIMVWRVEISGTDPFRLQANVIKRINDILDAGGTIRIDGVPYRFSAAEVDLLKGIRVGSCSSREVVFVIDRELSRDREFMGIHDPYKARQTKPILPETKGYE